MRQKITESTHLMLDLLSSCLDSLLANHFLEKGSTLGEHRRGLSQEASRSDKTVMSNACSYRSAVALSKKIGVIVILGKVLLLPSHRGSPFSPAPKLRPACSLYSFTSRSLHQTFSHPALSLSSNIQTSINTLLLNRPCQPPASP